MTSLEDIAPSERGARRVGAHAPDDVDEETTLDGDVATVPSPRLRERGEDASLSRSLRRGGGRALGLFTPARLFALLCVLALTVGTLLFRGETEEALNLVRALSDTAVQIAASREERFTPFSAPPENTTISFLAYGR